MPRLLMSLLYAAVESAPLCHREDSFAQTKRTA
jgi:hypothetical protein